MSKPIVNLIGAGKMGRNWASALRDFEGLDYLEFSAISDANPDVSYYVKSEHPERRFYEDVKEMIVKENPDGVIVAVPAGNHAKIIYGCVDAGCKKLLVEKPFVPLRKWKEGLEVMEYCSGRAEIMTGDIILYDPVMKSLMENMNKIGSIQSVVSYRINDYPWRMNDVDVIDDLAIHDFHGFRYMTGWPEVQIISSVHRSLMRENQKDYCSFRALSLDEVSFASTSAWIPGKHQMRLTYVRGSKTTAEMDYAAHRLQIKLESEGKEIEEIPVPKEDALRNELQEFVQFVSTNAHPLSTASEEMKTLTQMKPILSKD